MTDHAKVVSVMLVTSGQTQSADFPGFFLDDCEDVQTLTVHDLAASLVGLICQNPTTCAA